MKVQREEGPKAWGKPLGPQSGSQKVIFEVGSMCWRTPRKDEDGFAAPSSRVTDGGGAAVKTQRNNAIRAAMSRKSAIVIA